MLVNATEMLKKQEELASTIGKLTVEIEKMKKQQEMINAYANMNTKNIQSRANMSTGVNNNNTTNKTSSNNTNKTNTTSSSSAKPGSMMAKANMVKEYNERNNKN